MALIPSMLLKRLYTYASLQNTEEGVQFSLKNRLSDARLTAFHGISIDGKEISNDDLTLDFGEGHETSPDQVNSGEPVEFPLRKEVFITARIPPLDMGSHEIQIGVQTSPFGRIQFTVDDAISEKVDAPRIPRDRDDDYNDDIIQARQKFVKDYTGHSLEHISQYSFDPHETQGNI
ncbi:MAG: hydroxymethylglutaryl-CoA reductase, partial [Caldilineaceae bacterium]|nr:hydroxymethylglutaryl-CoA reductase [Caldilineaceae bacterium]